MQNEREYVDRIAKLEALLGKAYGMVSSGPATELSRTNFLHEIAAAIGWPDANAQAAAAIKRITNWAES